MKKTKVINLYGGPSIGKSVLAARLYGELACDPQFGSVEKVNEYAKLLSWEGDYAALADQPSVTKQQIRYFAPIGKCDYVVTDSPVDLGIVYASDAHLEEVMELIYDFHQNKPHEEINILLTRDRADFQKEGRVHSEEESIVKDNEIRQLLHEHKKKFIEVSNMISPAELSRIILQEYV